MKWTTRLLLVVVNSMSISLAYAQSQPSAVEIFKLRDMCQARAEEMFAKLKKTGRYDYILSDPMDKTTIVSNYSLKTMHCYVKIKHFSVNKFGQKIINTHITEDLYDGNTEEQLAQWGDGDGCISDPVYSGMACNGGNTRNYIDDKMATER
jgi:hypothetical protein